MISALRASIILIIFLNVCIGILVFLLRCAYVLTP